MNNLNTLLTALQADIMNIDCPYTRSCFPNEAHLLAYKEGHRDARHAACDVVAKLVLAFAQRIEEGSK